MSLECRRAGTHRTSSLLWYLGGSDDGSSNRRMLHAQICTTMKLQLIWPKLARVHREKNQLGNLANWQMCARARQWCL